MNPIQEAISKRTNGIMIPGFGRLPVRPGDASMLRSLEKVHGVTEKQIASMYVDRELSETKSQDLRSVLKDIAEGRWTHENELMVHVESIQAVAASRYESFDEAKERAIAQKSKCFIATAACGDEAAWEVQSLREFRDCFLLDTKLGRLFIDAYCCLSPEVARRIESRPPLQAVLRRLLVQPTALLARYFIKRQYTADTTKPSKNK